MVTFEFIHAWPNEELFLVTIESRIDSDGALAASVAYLQHTGNVLAIVNVDIQLSMDTRNSSSFGQA